MLSLGSSFYMVLATWNTCSLGKFLALNVAYQLFSTWFTFRNKSVKKLGMIHSGWILS